MLTPETPELDRQLEIVKSGKAGLIQDFIDWIYEEMHGEIHVRQRVLISEEACGFVEGSRFVPLRRYCDDGIIRAGRDPEYGFDTDTFCWRCKGTGVLQHFEDEVGPYDRGPEQLMADFFKIDRNKIEQERRALLESIRSA